MRKHKYQTASNLKKHIHYASFRFASYYGRHATTDYLKELITLIEDDANPYSQLVEIEFLERSL